MRKYFIDNIRWLVILMLCPFHTLLMYNAWGIDFNLLLEPSWPITVILSAFYYWAMPLLFLLAGCSARYSLKKRTISQYVKERITKLFLPFVAGVILLLPTQAYFAECYQCGFTGSVWEEYAIFFTGTGSTTFDNGINVAMLSHLWFILYLFAISFITLPFLALFLKKGWQLDKLPAAAVVFVGAALYILMDIFLPGSLDKNLIDMTFTFLWGFYCVFRDDVQAYIAKLRFVFTAAAVASFVLGWHVLWSIPFLTAVFSCMSILAIIAWGVKALNFSNRVSKYFTTGSYGIYFFHMIWVIGISYYLVINGASTLTHILITIPASFAATVGTYELARRIPGLRYVLALSKPKRKKNNA